jgi:thiamine-monophosphate kinase
VGGNGALDPDDMPLWLAGVLATARTSEAIVAGVDDDDCAVMRFGERLLVMTTDFLNASPIAIEIGLGGMADIGRLVVAANLADLCGSGATPICLLLAVTLPRGASTDSFRDMVAGAAAEAEKWGVPIVGGDTKLGSSRAVLAVGIGSAGHEDELFLRSRGEAGDDLWVSGEIGGCSAAVIGLERGNMCSKWNAWARRALLEPSLPLGRSRAAAENRLGRAGTDISDGLGADLALLCSASGVGAQVEAAAIPVAKEVAELASALDVPAYSFAFGIGGDFQFLLSSHANARAQLTALGFSRIGMLSGEPGVRLVTPAGAILPAPTVGHRDARGLSFAAEASSFLDPFSNRL